MHTTNRLTRSRADSGFGGSRTQVIGGKGTAGSPAIPDLPKRDNHVRVIART
jgi:hypothetical protein